MIASVNGMAAMKAFRADIRQRCAADGRDPDSLKIFFLLMPIIGRSADDAREKLESLRRSSNAVDRNGAFASAISNVDFAAFDMDARIPEVETQGGSGALRKMLGADPEATLREALHGAHSSSVELVGTVEEIAHRMLEIADEVQPDGFLFTPPYQRVSKAYAARLANELAPALQKNGLMSVSPKPGTLKQKIGIS